MRFLYKNDTHRCLVKEMIPDFCPDCLKQLKYKYEYRYQDYINYYNNHFKHKNRFCIMHSKTLQDICRKRKIKEKKKLLKKEKEKEEFKKNIPLYLIGTVTFGFVFYIQLKDFF